MQFLKQSTAGNDAFGPLIYTGNGALYTANDVTYNDVYLWRNGGAEAAANDVSFVPVGTSGYYTFAWGTGTPSDLGRLTVTLNKSGVTAPARVFEVVTANFRDTIGGNDTFDVQVTGMANDVITPEAIADAAITAAGIANDAIHADALSTGALNDIQGAANAALVALDLDHLVNNATGVPALPSGVLLDLLNDLVNLRAGTEAQTSFGQIINMMQGNDTFLDNAGLTDNSIAHFLRALASTAATLPTGLSNGTTYTNATMALQAIAAKTGVLTFTGNDVHSRVEGMANDVLTAAAIATGAITSDALANDTITAASIATDAIGNDALSNDAVTAIQAGLSTHSAADVVTAMGNGTFLTALGTAANQTTILGYVDCLPATWVTVPTTAEIKTAIEAAGGHLALILEDTGTTLPALISAQGSVVSITTESTNISTD